MLLLSVSLFAVKCREKIRLRLGEIRDCYTDISGIKALRFEAPLNLKEGLTDLMAWSESPQTVSRVHDSCQKLVEKGLILDTQ